MKKNINLSNNQNPFTDPEYIKQHLFDGDTTGFVEAGVTDSELNMDEN